MSIIEVQGNSALEFPGILGTQDEDKPCCFQPDEQSTATALVGKAGYRMLARHPLVLKLQQWATILGLNAVYIGLNSADHVLVKWRGPSTWWLCTAGVHSRRART